MKPTDAQKALMQKIFEVASEELGVEELAGGQHNPRVLAYHAATTSGAKVDEEAWCAAFVSFILEALKLKSTDSAWSRSYVNWGKPLEQGVRGGTFFCISCLGFILGQGSNIAFYKLRQGFNKHLASQVR